MLIGKEKKPLKAKDIVKLEDLQMKHPLDLTDADKIELEKLTERRNTYGQI